MNTFILQTPINRPIMIKARKEAKRAGFRSVQELVNLFLTKVANHGLSISLNFEERLSRKTEARLAKIQEEAEKEIENGTTKVYTSDDEIMKNLLK